MSDRYELFKELGTSELYPGAEGVRFPSGPELIYRTQDNTFQLLNRKQIGNLTVIIMIPENGLGVVKSHNFSMFVEDLRDGIHYVKCLKEDIEFCLENNVILSVESGVHKELYSVYGVKFNRDLDL